LSGILEIDWAEVRKICSGKARNMYGGRCTSALHRGSIIDDDLRTSEMGAFLVIKESGIDNNPPPYLGV